jgi:hypothetical protein
VSKPSKPIGGGGARNPRSLANLQPGAGAGDGGLQRARTHGAYTEALVRDVSAEVRELMELLAEGAPVREPDGSLPAADVVAVEMAARALKRWRSVSTYCDLHGRVDPKTHKARGAARYELDCEVALDRRLDVLGMNPTARLKLGMKIARTEADRATQLTTEREAREAGAIDAEVVDD